LEAASFVLSVADNGRGFDPGQIDSARAAADRFASGNGLENMRQRLLKIGGRCEIRTAAGQGTTVAFVVPVSPPPGREGSEGAEAMS
jgi:signal transduction histidine kinase